MSYHYNLWGWYDGEVNGGERTTEIAPPETKGNLRPNWTGHKWLLMEYQPPPEPAKEPEPLTVEERLRRIEEALGL